MATPCRPVRFLRRSVGLHGCQSGEFVYPYVLRHPRHVGGFCVAYGTTPAAHGLALHSEQQCGLIVAVHPLPGLPRVQKLDRRRFHGRNLLTLGVRGEFTALHDRGVLSLGAGAMINSPHFGEAASALVNAANLAVFTTDPRILVAATAVLVAVSTIVFSRWFMRYALRDESTFDALSSDAQALREAEFLDQFTGRHEYMADAPHVAGVPGSPYFAGVGAAHDDRSSNLLPADRSLAGAA